MTQKNQWNQQFQVKNLGRIWPNYPQGKINPLIKNWNFYKRLILNLLLPLVVIYWYDHMQVSNPRIPSHLDL